MVPAVDLIEVDRLPIAVVSLRPRQSDISRAVTTGCGEVWDHIRTRGFVGAGRNIAVYHDWDGHFLSIEAGVELLAPFDGEGRIHVSETPAGTAAHGVHIGPYASLGGTHEAVLHLVENERRLLAGPSWEIYGHWTDDVSRLRTDVYYLLRPRN